MTDRVRIFLSAAFTGFGPVIVYYAVLHFFGMRSAIICALAFTVLEIARRRIKKETVPPFFLFTAAMTIVFGCIDLSLQTSVLFRFESVLNNVMLGIYFGVTLYGSKTIIQQFAEMNGPTDRPMTEAAVEWFRICTAAWTVYFFLRAAVFFYIGMNFGIEQGLVLRLIIGNVTNYLLLAVSIFGRRPVMRLVGRI